MQLHSIRRRRRRPRHRRTMRMAVYFRNRCRYSAAIRNNWSPTCCSSISRAKADAPADRTTIISSSQPMETYLLNWIRSFKHVSETHPILPETLYSNTTTREYCPNTVYGLRDKSIAFDSDRLVRYQNTQSTEKMKQRKRWERSRKKRRRRLSNIHYVLRRMKNKIKKKWTKRKREANNVRTENERWKKTHFLCNVISVVDANGVCVWFWLGI